MIKFSSWAIGILICTLAVFIFGPAIGWSKPGVDIIPAILGLGWFVGILIDLLGDLSGRDYSFRKDDFD